MPPLASWGAMAPLKSATGTEQSKVLRSTRHKIGHFGEVLPSQSLGCEVLKLKDFQGPVASNSRTFKALFCFQGLPGPGKNGYCFPGLSRTCGHPVQHLLILLSLVLGPGHKLGSGVVSVLDSGTEGPGFKSLSRRCRVTVLGKLFTPVVSVHKAAKLVAALLRVAR